MNKNWSRWIYSSIVQHFTAASFYKTFVEAEPRTTWEEKDFIEIRMDGPYWVLLDGQIWEGLIEVNVLIQSVIDFLNLYKIHSMAGEIAEIFTQEIQIFKYGPETEDDQSFLGCVELLQNKRERQILAISHFGQLAPEKNLQQATVEGHFKIQLT